MGEGVPARQASQDPLGEGVPARPASQSSSSGGGKDLLVECDEEERSAHLADKVKRLESLLAKCKVGTCT